MLLLVRDGKLQSETLTARSEAKRVPLVLKHSHGSDVSLNGRESTRGVVCEVGRIVINNRVFLVVRNSDLSASSCGKQHCCFTIGGLKLVAIEEKDLRRPVEQPSSADSLLCRLTGRELEIAILVAQGLATKNIAHRLQISEWTVSTYLRRIFAKLHVESRAAMVYRCAPLIRDSLSTGPGPSRLLKIGSGVAVCRDSLIWA
jgi:DNA-binding CsgD family transcriptional regulator